MPQSLDLLGHVLPQQLRLHFDLAVSEVDVVIIFLREGVCLVGVSKAGGQVVEVLPEEPVGLDGAQQGQHHDAGLCLVGVERVG